MLGLKQKTGKYYYTPPQFFWTQILLMSNQVVRPVIKPKTLQKYEK